MPPFAASAFTSGGNSATNESTHVLGVGTKYYPML
jgi:hypothetical protein